MFQSFAAGDAVLHSAGFMKDEVQNSLIHSIVEYPDALKLTTSDGSLLFVQSKGYNPWLWVSGEVGPAQRIRLIEQLIESLQELPDSDFPGITAEPQTARIFAGAYCAVRGKLYHTNMLLESYQCTEVRKPSGVQGTLVQSATGHIPVIAEFTAGFARDAFGASQPVEHYLPHVDAAVRTGNLHLWMVGDAPVAMAKTVHRSARLCRINDVYTSGEFRKQGYASSLVAELCEQVLAEGLTPVLFADGKNPDSNKVYQSIGFVQAGKIAEIKFE